MPTSIYYCIFLIFLEILTVPNWTIIINFYKINTCYIKNGKQNEFCERCLAEGNSIDDEDKELLNLNGVSILQLEKSLERCEEFSELENDNLNCSFNSYELLYTLIEELIVNNAQNLVSYLHEFQNEITSTFEFDKYNSDNDMIFICDVIKTEVNKFVNSLSNSVTEDLHFLYNKLENNAADDRNSLKEELYRVFHPEEFIFKNTLTFEPLKEKWEIIRRQKNILQEFIKEGNALMYILKKIGYENQFYFPFFFIKNFVISDRNQNVYQWVYGIINRIKTELDNFLRYKNLLVSYINVYEIQMINTMIKNELDTISVMIRKVCCKLLKYLSQGMGGPIRGIVGMFIYIFKMMETKYKYNIDDDFFDCHPLINIKNIKTCFNELHMIEKGFLKNNETYFAQKIYSFFQIDIHDAKWKSLAKRFTNCEHLDKIMETLKKCATLIFIQKSIMKFHQLFNGMSMIIHGTVNFIRVIMKNSHLSPETVMVPSFIFTQFYNSLKIEINTQFQVLDIIQYEQRMALFGDEIIKQTTLLQRVLNLINLFEELSGEMINRRVTNVEAILEKKMESKLKAKSKIELEAEAEEVSTFSGSSTEMMKRTKKGKQEKREKQNVVKLFQQNLTMDEAINESTVLEMSKAITPKALYLLFYILNNLLL